MNVFAQIRKVDEEKRLVYGRAAQEMVDKSDEVMDYASSKPHFQKWSEEVSADTDGKSLGNLRAMHGKVAAGKLTGIEFNDTDKAIDVVAKVIDDNEWKKVLEGVYTGFSIGGSYVGEKMVEKVAGRDVKRYTARPNELSLVDRPCIPASKFFEVQKADGTVAQVEFRPATSDEEVAVDGTAEDVAELGKLMNERKLDVAGVIALLLKTAPPFAGKESEAEEAAEKEREAAWDKEGLTEEQKVERRAKLKEEAGAEKFNGAVDELLKAATGLLQKAGARNSAVDSARIAKVHELSVELGAECITKQVLTPAGDLSKSVPLAEEQFQKLVADAVAPLTKALEAANQKIAKLEALPAPTRVVLKAVSKQEDTGEGDAALSKLQNPEDIVDSLGEKHEAAGLIKSLHQIGGVPLAMPALRK